MIIEISVAVISLMFVVLTVFTIITLRDLCKSVKQIRADVNALTFEGIELMDNVNELTEDLKQKSEALNCVFGIFDKQKAEVEHRRSQKSSEKIAEIIEVVSAGLDLVNRIKGDIKRYVKSK